MSGTAEYSFRSELWLHDGDGGWHFLTVPHEVSDEIDARTVGSTRGFGSVRVRARIGTSMWSTSVFPDSKRKAFVLPVKKSVRIAEGISAGDRVAVVLALADG